MKMLSTVVLVLMMVSVGFTATLPAGLVMSPDGSGAKVPIQGWAPNGKKAQNLTAAQTVINHTNNSIWGLYTPANCSFRLQSTATKAGLWRTWIGGGSRGLVTKNPATPFVSYSGCNQGELDAMP